MTLTGMPPAITLVNPLAVTGPACIPGAWPDTGLPFTLMGLPFTITLLTPAVTLPPPESASPILFTAGMDFIL
jgi:hypothetical protein